jgi:hypothetical protein
MNLFFQALGGPLSILVGTSFSFSSSSRPRDSLFVRNGLEFRDADNTPPYFMLRHHT